MANFDHVIEERRHFVDADKPLRLSVIYEDVWINYPLADYALRMVGTLLKMPEKIQAPSVLIYGDPGMGKTALFERIARAYGFSSGAEKCIACLTLAEENPENSKAFRSLVVRSLTAGVYNNPGLADEILLASIRSLNIKALAIDEFNDMLLCSPLEVRKNIKLLKKLSGKPFCLSIIGLGIDDSESVIAYEKQMARRFERIHLKPWQAGEELERFLASFEAVLPLKYSSELYSRSTINFLLKETNGVLDDILKRICNAAAYAVLEGGEKITIDLLRKSKIRPIF